MRVRNRHHLRRHYGKIIGLGLIPVVLVASLGLTVLAMYRNMSDYMTECGPPDPAKFLPTNYSRLAEMAFTYDYLLDRYHLPLNMAVPIRWDKNFTRVVSYDGDDGDNLIWQGTTLAAQCFRYEAARQEGNKTLQAEALVLVRKLLTGMSMCLAVPNGGIGPEYGGVVARYWGSPEHREITPALFSDDWDPSEESFFNGTGPYSQYRYSAHTSNDQLNGLYLGIGMTLKFVAPHDIFVRDLVTRMIDQVCTNMVRNNFLVIDGNGGPDGADQKRQGIGGYNALVILKLGAVALPEKFASKYHHYLLSDEYIATIKDTTKYIESLTSYYALNFAHHGWLTLMLLEEDPDIQAKLVEIFETGMRKTVQYHRNAWFDVIHLVVTGDEDSILRGSVEDQLMRFEISHFPDRDYERPVLPAGEYKFVEGPRIYNKFFDTPVGSLVEGIFSEVGLEEEKIHTDKPLTVEYQVRDSFLWQRSPFRYYRPTEGNPQSELTGISFTTPYWLARAFGIIPASN